MRHHWNQVHWNFYDAAYWRKVNQRISNRSEKERSKRTKYFADAVHSIRQETKKLKWIYRTLAKT